MKCYICGKEFQYQNDWAPEDVDDYSCPECKEKERYFSVDKEYMTGEIHRYEINSDGTKSGDAYGVKGEEYACKMLTGFVVNVYGADGLTEEVQFYPVKSDTSVPPICDDTGDWVYQSDEDAVLKKIYEEHAPEDGWQNYNW